MTATRIGALVLALAGCAEPADDGEVFRAEIGPDGGELSGAGLTLTFPPGALATTEALEMRVSDDGPEDYVPVSDRYRFEPEGLEFAELVTMELEVETDDQGTLYWSTLDGGYEQVGLTSAGLGEATTWHFSDTFAGEGTCPLPASTTKCNCRASDEQEDLLCVDDPSTGATCDITGFSGSDGGTCAGYGPRTSYVPWCSCLSTDGNYLCPDEYEFQPSQQCPTEGGLNGFHGVEREECSGYDVAWDPQTNTSSNVAASGQIVDCQIVADDTTFQSVSGTLEGCYETSAPVPAPPCHPGQNAYDAFCLGLISDLTQRRKDEALAAGRKPVQSACPADDLNQAAIQGSRAGNLIEAQFLADDPDPTRPTHFTQFEIPNAKKGPECYRGNANSGTVGNVDLLRIVSSDPTQVVVEIGEVKPMTNSGLDAGRRDIYQCYATKLAAAGAQCADPAAAADIQAMCAELGANGRPVVLAPSSGLSWAPKDVLPVQFPAGGGGATNELFVQTCAPGIVAYQCAD